MNNEFTELRPERVQVNAKAILMQCISKAWLIVVCTMVCAVALASVMYVKDLQDYEEVISNIEEESNSVVVDKYLLLRNRVQQLENYGAKSIILSINPEKVYQGRIQFYIEADSAVQTDIAYALVNYVTNKTLAIKLGETGLFEHADYVYEIVSAGVTGAVNGMPTGIVNLYVWADSEANCLKYMESVKTIFQDYSDKLQISVMPHKLTVVQEEVICCYLQELYTIQANYVQARTTAEAEFKAYRNSLTELQKLQIATALDEEWEDVQVTQPQISVKYIVLGGAVGFVLAIGIIILMVALGGKIQTEEGIADTYGIVNFGSLKKNSQQLDVVVAHLQLFSQKNAYQKIGFVSTRDVWNNVQVTALKEQLKEKGVVCEFCGNITADPNALSCVVNQDAIVMIEELGETSAKRVGKQVALCEQLKVSVVGYFTVSKW